MPEVDLKIVDVELKNQLSNNDNIYPLERVSIEKSFFTIFELKRKYVKDNFELSRIILDSSFQRKSVWGISKKRELIESVLMGLPLPIFYFNQDSNGKLIVVDGRQRLGTFFDFMDGKFKLDNLKILKKYNKKGFSDLDPLDKTRFEDSQLVAYVISPSTPEKVKFDIFDRVNRTGVKLNKQEIRHALHLGKSTELLKKIIALDIFHKVTDDAFAKDTRMKDEYIVLRYLAIYLYHHKKVVFKSDNNRYEYKGDMDELLAKTMDYINLLSDYEVKMIFNDVIATLENSYAYFGENAFRLVKSGKKSPINMNLFETILYICNGPLLDANESKVLKDNVEKMLSNSDFLISIGSHRDTEKNMNTRISMANKIRSLVYD